MDITSEKGKIDVAMWNLCLGLSYKKIFVIDMLKDKSIRICRSKETEIQIVALHG